MEQMHSCHLRWCMMNSELSSPPPPLPPSPLFRYPPTSSWSFVHPTTKRGLHVEAHCPLCERWPETTMHALWTCPTIKKIRSMCKFMIGFGGVDSYHFLDFIMICQNQLLNEKFELLCMVLWWIWFRRNMKVHDNSMIQEEEVVTWVATFLEDFRRANDQGGGCVREMGGSIPKWIPPD